MNLCIKHGGDISSDAFWRCDICSSEGIDKCSCGGNARYFGEALMCSVKCENCDAYLMDVGEDLNIRERWNQGERSK